MPTPASASDRPVMHVALNGWFWDQPFTGSGQYVRRLVIALHELAPDQRLSLVIPGHMRRVDGLPPEVDILPVRLPLRGNWGKIWFEQRGFPQAVARLKADIAHVPYWGPPLRVPAPLVCSVLDVIPLAIPQYRTGLMNRLYTSLVVAGARGAAHILTISEASKRDIVRYIRIPAERISVTHLAVEKTFHPDEERAADSAVLERYGLDDVGDFVLYLGSYAIHKNVRLLLAAYTYVIQGLGMDVPLVLAGHTPSTWGTARFPDLPGFASEIGVADAVRWLGPVDETDKAALYRLASVFVFPSRYEGFGFGPLEAMASGTPVVACEASSLPEVAGEAAYLVPPDDSRAMGGAILSLLTQPDLAATLRQRGLARSREFSWRKTAEGTLAAFERVLRSD